MKILDDIISTLKGDSEIQKMIVGVYWTAVLSRNCGLSSTFHDPPPHHLVNEAGNFSQKTARELVEYAHSEVQLEASIGMAALNSLIDIETDQCAEVNALDVLEEQGMGKNVAVVGHFPFVPRLRKVAGTLWVLELNLQEGDLSAEEAVNILPQADVVCITGTSFINHTVEFLLSLCRQDSLVMMIGATTPMSPVLFDFGVDMIAGALVVDHEKAMRCISQGATFRQITGVKRMLLAK